MKKIDTNNQEIDFQSQHTISYIYIGKQLYATGSTIFRNSEFKKE